MFCTKCGLNITNDNANFCKRCGNKIRKSQNNPTFVTRTPSDFVQRARNRLVEIATPTIEKTKKFTVKKIDGIQENLNNENKYKKLSQDQRQSLAQRLSNLRTKLSDQQAQNEEISVEEAQEIVEVSDELLEQIKDDKCLICYKSLKKEGEDNLVLCPHCGHGGHKNHIYSWFESKENCPYCKKEVKLNEVLILTI